MFLVHYISKVCLDVQAIQSIFKGEQPNRGN